MKTLFSIALLIFALVFTAGATPVNTIWVGAEDLTLPGGDKDYNDMIFSLLGPNLTVKGSGAWQPMVAPNQDGVPFWDNPSYDGPGGWNIGYFMTGIGNFAGNPNSPALPVSGLSYWGVGTSPDSNIRFFSTGGIQSIILAEVAAYSGSNSLYWFPASNPSALSLIFSGADGVGTAKSFNPDGADFGLELVSPGGTYLTTGAGNQFAPFEQSPVPEPASYFLLGSGLIGLGLIGRKKFTGS